MKTYLLYLYTESPLHAGGAEADGAVDLPIQREAATNYPLIWGQSLKGALRAAARDEGWSEWAQDGRSLLDEVFGQAVGGEQEPGLHAGAGLLSVGDAQLVALPVPTLQRTFAWATSPLALNRLARKHTHARTPAAAPPVPRPAEAAGMCISEDWPDGAQVLGPCLVPLNRPREGRDHPLSSWGDLLARDGIGEQPHLAAFAEKLRRDLILVGSDVMGQLLRECTEHTVRVQLTPDTKTVKHVFTSEYLPAETLLAAVLTLRTDHPHTDLHQEQLAALLHQQIRQIGGDETLGKGLVWTRLVEGDSGG